MNDLTKERKRDGTNLICFASPGMTECSGLITMQYSCHKNGSCGTIIENGEIKIVDPDSKKILGPNQLGEIYLKVAGIMNGYYRNPEATKNAFDKEGKKTDLAKT